jgi:phospho-N-acetylmuramoyl-pentapeptide-transferase
MAIFNGVKILIIFTISFLTALLLTPLVFHFLQKFNLRKKNIRDEKSAPVFYQFHKDKSNTPTMGGIIIWGTTIFLALLFALLGYFLDGFFSYLNFISREETYIPLAALLLGAIIGMFDDVLGILGKGPHGGGLNLRLKLLLYTGISILTASWFYFKLDWHLVYIPLIGNVDFGFWYFIFFIFVIVATAFSANETDGLDGLLGGVMLFAFGALAVVAFIIHKYYLATMIASLLGGLLAFLWFNIYPAKFFMGDTGSMSLGITLGIIAMLTHTEFFLPFFGLILVGESLSVIIQTISKKIYHRKIFLSTPIHHHFQGKGWPESQITMRFWIISSVAVMVGLVIFFLDKFA